MSSTAAERPSTQLIALLTNTQNYTTALLVISETHTEISHLIAASGFNGNCIVTSEESATGVKKVTPERTTVSA